MSEWWIKCGPIDTTVEADSASDAFIKAVTALPEGSEQELALIFRATKRGSRGRYFSTETILRNAGLLEYDDGSPRRGR